LLLHGANAQTQAGGDTHDLDGSTERESSIDSMHVPAATNGVVQGNNTTSTLGVDEGEAAKNLRLSP